MVRREFATAGDLIVMTPIIQGQERNVVRIERYQSNEEVPGDILHIAAGEHTGIIIRQINAHLKDDKCRKTPDGAADGDIVHLNFRAYIRCNDEATAVHRVESRDLKFHFYDGYDYDVRHSDAQAFFKAITLDFAKGECGEGLNRDFRRGSFRLRQLHQAFAEIIASRIRQHSSRRRRHACCGEGSDRRAQGDQYPLVNCLSVIQWGLDDNETEVESITLAHLQDIFDTAYPSALSTKQLCE